MHCAVSLSLPCNLLQLDPFLIVVQCSAACSAVQCSELGSFGNFNLC